MMKLTAPNPFCLLILAVLVSVSLGFSVVPVPPNIQRQHVCQTTRSSTSLFASSRRDVVMTGLAVLVTTGGVSLPALADVDDLAMPTEEQQKLDEVGWMMVSFSSIRLSIPPYTRLFSQRFGRRSPSSNVAALFHSWKRGTRIAGFAEAFLFYRERDFYPRLATLLTYYFWIIL